MTAIDVIREPVTGREEFGDVTRPLQALARFYGAFNNRDLPLMEENWDHSDQPVVITPLAGVVRGWREIRNGYDHLFSSSVKMQTEFYDYTVHVFGDLFYAVGRERGEYSAKNVNLKAGGYATNIFRRTSDGQWRQIHHHVSVEDPAAFQAAFGGPRR